MAFASREDAGQQLAEVLRDSALITVPADQIVVLGLPRGGVIVAAEVADALGARLDVIVVRKLGVPFQPELAMGAIGEGGVQVVSADVMAHAGVTDREFAEVEARERAELNRRAERYRHGEPPAPLNGQLALIVDDGVATGSTARAACQIARARGAATVVLAVPVAPVGFGGQLGTDADGFVCVLEPSMFRSIGQFYLDFRPTTHDEVVACLTRGRAAGPGTTGRY